MPRTPHLRRFWWQWIVANGLGELLGLGGVALIGLFAFRQFGEPTDPTQVARLALGMVALGAFEGAVVGWAQARVLRTVLPGLRGWVRATVVGAVVAWAIGMLPSTLMSLAQSPDAQAAAEPALPLVLLLAAALGLVAGPLLAVFQWRRLRTVVAKGSAWWLAANAAAWALGMPIIFIGVQADALGANAIVTGLAVAASLFVAGAVVGAVHGRVLMWLLHRRATGSER